jgi:hypothetical protein
MREEMAKGTKKLVGLLLLHCLIAMAEAEYLNTKIQSSH